jgi:hypothetical protein
MSDDCARSLLVVSSRVTWRALTTEPILVAARLARTLAARDAAVPG